MVYKTRSIFWIAVALIMAGTAGSFLGYRAGVAATMHAFVGLHGQDERLRYAVRYALGIESFNGLYGQDLWLLHTVFPGEKNGFFVDLGSADGTEISNSKRLEEAGWTGICIDPFPRNMSGRTCSVFEEAVDGEGGRVVNFHSPGTYGGGIVEFAGWWVSPDSKAKTEELTTTTVADILDRAGAPPFIHYMSVDIEGAEYDALKAFPFDRYKFGAVSVEHNNLEERRMQLRELFERNGYRLEWSIRDQDWYVRKDQSLGRVTFRRGSGLGVSRDHRVAAVSRVPSASSIRRWRVAKEASRITLFSRVQNGREDCRRSR